MHRTFQRPFRTILAIVMRAVTIFSLKDTLTVKMLVNNKEKPYQRYSACIFFVQFLVTSIDNTLIYQYWDQLSGNFPKLNKENSEKL